ncbi:MAG TPA: CotH kinase family protein [Solirubrobacterales bacterium]|nr:CotH kinase family protein [Solirubrobacterales bacterium]
MADPRLIAAALATLALLVFAPAASAALSAETLYEPDTVVVIDLKLSEAAVAALEAEPDEYVEGEFRIAETDGTPEGIGPYTEPLTVGVRLKGGAGSFKGLDKKAAFKVKFDEFVDDQTFLGLEKLTLNNMAQDPSMVHEALVYPAFRAAGVPAPHTGYAYVYLNGIDYGLHLNLEVWDKIALEKRFGAFQNPPQHLYEGGAGQDLEPGMAAEYEVDEGKSKTRTDLEALITAANATEPSFTPRLAPVADLEEMVAMWAAERYLGQWDGYSGGLPNNYYLYSDPAGVFQMLPSGTDQTLSDWWYSFTSKGGLLFNQCLAEEACYAAYVKALETVEETSVALDLPDQAKALAALLAPWQEQEVEESERAPFDLEFIEEEFEKTLKFLAKRPQVLADWLGTGELPEEPNEEEPEEEEEPKEDPGKPNPFEEIPKVPQPFTIDSRLELDRSRLGRGLVIVRATVSGPGALSLIGSTGPADDRRRACTVAAKQVQAGPAILHCRLSEATRRRLAKAPLTLRLNVNFQPGDGNPLLTVSRLARLPRQA